LFLNAFDLVPRGFALLAVSCSTARRAGPTAVCTVHDGRYQFHIAQ